MLAKLIVYAPTRDAAVERMHRALLELTIEGVETSRDFHLRVMEDAEFRAGAIEIQWLERRLGRSDAVEAAAETASFGGHRRGADRRSRALGADVARRSDDGDASARQDARRVDAWLRAGAARGAAMSGTLAV